MEPPTTDELEIARIILKHVDKDSLAVLTGDAARDLQPLVKLPAPTLAQIWGIVDPSGAGFLRFDEIVQFVRLIGYAQVNEPNISRSLLRKAGPVARIDGWTAPKGKTYDKPCDEPEGILLTAIMKEADPDGYGILDGDAAKTILRRSGLPNSTLSEIWDIVDDTQKGFLLAEDLKKALRLISCAQRGLRLHPRQSENPCPLPDLDDSFVSSVAPISVPAIAGPPSFPIPSISTVPASSGQIKTLPTRPPDDPLPPLTENERKAFVSLFNRHNPIGGVITGAQGKEIFNKSRLPVETLAHVWNLADADQSGNLTLTEFIVAMYLIKYLMDKKPKQPPAFIPPWLLAEASKGDSNTVPTLSNGTTTQFQPPAGPPPNHLRSHSQPPQPSLLDADDATIDAIARPATTSPRPNAPNLGSMHGRSRSDYLNRPTPPPPLAHRLSEEAPPPYVEWDPSPRVQV